MKTIRLLTLISAGLFMTAAFTACDSNGSGADSHFEFSAVSGKAAFRFDESAIDYNRDEDMVVFDTASIVLPTKILGREVSALRDSIVKAAFDTIASPVDAMNAFFADNAAEYGYKPVQLPATEANNDNGDGLCIIKGSVFNLTGSRLTYLVTREILAPAAANGMSSIRFFTYDIDHAKMVTLQDIFTEEGLKALPGLIRGRALHLAPAIGPTDITALPAEGNFYISLTNEMVFVYQPFEVAAHAQGEISVPFEGYQLQDLMTPYGLSLFDLR